MTPKEKARELVDKMYLKIPSVYDPTNLPHYPIAKEMSLIAVDEMIIQNGELYLNSLGDKTIKFYKEKNGYLFELKQEIELL